MTVQKDTSQFVVVDARTFQPQLELLATTIALKVNREGHSLLSAAQFVVQDIYFLLRQMQQTYNLLFFINADEVRKKGVNWVPAYSAVTLPLVRTMIDCLYNITKILENPGTEGRYYRASGYRNILKSLDDDSLRYGGDPARDKYIEGQRSILDMEMRINGFALAEVQQAVWWRFKPISGLMERTSTNVCTKSGMSLSR